MAEIVLIVGGCRSGKSAYAQRLAESLPAGRAYVATCPVTDDEMGRRIAAHRDARHNRGWETIEEQTDLVGVLRQAPQPVLLVDCVTLWVNNLMYHAEVVGQTIGEDDIAEACRRVLEAAAGRPGTVIFVSNEVGMGIVPDNAAARRYRDLVGRANQVLAAGADTVTLLSCGIPVQLKQKSYMKDDCGAGAPADDRAGRSTGSSSLSRIFRETANREEEPVV